MSKLRAAGWVVVLLASVSTSRAWHYEGHRMVAAIAPVHLVGALAPEIQDDLGFGDAEQGIAIGVFFAVSAVCSSPGGALTDRIGEPTGAIARVDEPSRRHRIEPGERLVRRCGPRRDGRARL